MQSCNGKSQGLLLARRAQLNVCQVQGQLEPTAVGSVACATCNEELPLDQEEIEATGQHVPDQEHHHPKQEDFGHQQHHQHTVSFITAWQDHVTLTVSVSVCNTQ
jgi:hypothetical protein